MEDKLAKLKAILAEGPFVIAFSGGADSAFLLVVAHEIWGGGVVAATAVSPLLPASEREAAAAFCAAREIEQIVIEVDPLADKAIAANTPERCYLCKHVIFERIKDLAAELTLERIADSGVVGVNRTLVYQVADGTNADDVNEDRPGVRALEELGVQSPLRDVGLTKREIRELSQEMGIETWEKPSSPCLATRIPFGTPLTREDLARIEASEDFLRELGFEDIRVRAHGDIARIEVYTLQLPRLSEPETRRLVTKRFKELGFKHVTADLEGFHSGGANL